MSNNPKNRLQECYQSKKLPLPIYESERRGGADHKPKWSSQVTLHDGSVYSSEGTYPSRKLAEKAAAKTALERGNFNLEDQTEGAWEDEGRDIYIIDVENMARASLELLRKIRVMGPPPYDHIEILFVMSKGCTLLDRITAEITEMDSETHNVNYSVTNSLRKDAADILIVMEATRCAARNKDDVIYIVSNDRFAATFAEVSNYSSKSTVVNITSLEELMSTIIKK